MIKTLEQRLKEVGYREGYFRKQILNTVKEWLQQKQNNINSRNPTIARDTYSFINELLEELK